MSLKAGLPELLTKASAHGTRPKEVGSMDFPRFRLLGTRLRTAVVRLKLTDVLLFLLLLLFARHEWANRTPAGRYVKYPFGSGEVVLLDTTTGTIYVKLLDTTTGTIYVKP